MCFFSRLETWLCLLSFRGNYTVLTVNKSVNDPEYFASSEARTLRTNYTSHPQPSIPEAEVFLVRFKDSLYFVFKSHIINICKEMKGNTHERFYIGPRGRGNDT